jgi:hypothetical protein
MTPPDASSTASREPIPVAAPPRVRDLLRTAPDGPLEVLHRGPLAVYVAVGDRAVGLLAQTAVSVPNGLRSTISQFSPDQGLSSYSESGVLHVDGRPLSVRRTVGVHIPPVRYARSPGNTASSATFAATPPAAVAEFVVSGAPHGVDAGAVARLVGCGEGLTPLGDDVLCGWLAAHRAAGVATPEVDLAVRTHVHRTTLLSATLLDCALEGEGLPELGAWLHALGSPAEAAAAAALLAVGGTSGAGLMAGAMLALDALRRTTDRATDPATDRAAGVAA